MRLHYEGVWLLVAEGERVAVGRAANHGC